MINMAVAGQLLPIYGNGENIRDWLHVLDHCDGLLAAFNFGIPGQVYNFGGNTELENISVITQICEILDRLQPRPDSLSYLEQISFVEDRKGHDFRYAINIEKARNQLHWEPKIKFSPGLITTVEWYLERLPMK